MVRNLSITGGLHLTSSVSVRAASASASASASVSDSSAPVATSKLDDTSGSGTEKAPGAAGARVEVASSDTQTDLEDQATEMSERKTVLIR